MRSSRSAVLSVVSVVLLSALFVNAVTVNAQTFTGIGTWTQQNDYGSSSTTPGTGGMAILGVSCVTNLGDVFCVGGQNATGTDLSDVFFAQLSSTGSIGPWTETTDYGAASGTSGKGGVGIEWPSCVAYNGYIYCVAGATNGGIVSKVFYAQLSSSGVGPWTETTDYGAASGDSGSGGTQLFQLACVAYNGYIYCTGGGPSTVFYAQLSSSGVGPWTETTDYGAASGNKGTGGVPIESNACVESSGDIYCIGGTSTSFAIVSDVFYAPLSSSGVGAWTETTDYGASSGTSGKGGIPIYGTTCTSTGVIIVCVAGDTTGNSGTAGVYYAIDGGLGQWFPSAAFAAATYWLNCVQNSGYNNIYCWGGASDEGYSAPLLTGSTSTSSSSSTTTTPVAPTTTSVTPTTTTSVVISATSSTTTTPIVEESTTEASSTTAVGVGVGTPWGWIGVGIVILLIIIGIGLYFWRKPKPDGKPPPEEGTEEGTEGTNEPCEVSLEPSEKESEFEVDVDVSTYWKPPIGLPYFPPKTGKDGNPKSDLAQYFEEQIKTRKNWDAEKLGTAIAVSDGAAVGATIDAGAKIWLGEGTAFPWNLFNGDQRRLLATVRSEGETPGSVVPLEAEAGGWTKIKLELESKHGKGAVSAAVLVASRAQASVMDPEWHLIEMISTSVEVIVKLLEIFERVVKELKVKGELKLEVIKAIEEGIEELKELINAYREAKGALDKARILTETVQKSKEIIHEFYTYLGYEVALMYLVPLIIEHYGKKWFAAANVELEAEGEMEYTVGSCGSASIKATAALELEVKKGEVEKPNPPVYLNARLSRRIGACTSSGALDLDIVSKATVSGKAKEGGEGSAYVDSLWAAAWAWCCKGEDEGDHPGIPSPVQVDSTFGARFVITPLLESEHPGMDANGIRKLVQDEMTSKLDDLLLTAIRAGSLPCPAEDPAAAEEALKNILSDWLVNVQTKFALFLPGGAGNISGTGTVGGGQGRPGSGEGKGSGSTDGGDEGEGTGTVGDNAEDQGEPGDREGGSGGKQPNPTEQVM